MWRGLTSLMGPHIPSFWKDIIFGKHSIQSHTIPSSYLSMPRYQTYSNTTGATSGAETANPSGAPEFTFGF
jgi:hypothetical protein